MCRQWLLEIRAETHSENAVKAPGTMSWGNGYLERRQWASHGQKVKGTTTLYTWGVVMKMHGGEAETKAAMERKEVQDNCT